VPALGGARGFDVPHPFEQMKIPDRNPVRFDSESCFNVCAAGRVDRRTALSSGHLLHSSAATSLAFVAAWRPIARRSIARADRAQVRCGSASIATFRSCALQAACAAPSKRMCSSAFSNAATCTAASRASGAAGAATTCFSPFPARRATSARAATRSASSPTVSGPRGEPLRAARARRAPRRGARRAGRCTEGLSENRGQTCPRRRKNRPTMRDAGVTVSRRNKSGSESEKAKPGSDPEDQGVAAMRPFSIPGCCSQNVATGWLRSWDRRWRPGGAST